MLSFACCICECVNIACAPTWEAYACVSGVHIEGAIRAHLLALVFGPQKIYGGPPDESLRPDICTMRNPIALPPIYHPP